MLDQRLCGILQCCIGKTGKVNRKGNTMNELIKTLTNTRFTENGAVTNKSSLNPLVDFIFLAGASRKVSEEDISALVARAFAFDREKTVKLIFWAGNIRGGLGERRFFRTALKYLASYLSMDNNPTDLSARLHVDHTVTQNLYNIVYFSRWDVLFDLYEDVKTNHEIKSAILEYVLKAFNEGTDPLLFKWLPREKSKKFPTLRKKITELVGGVKAYRKTLAAKSKVVETEMSANRWDIIKYQHVPSKAMSNYSIAFRRHSPDRFVEYLESLNKGAKKINSSVLFPSDLIKALGKDPETADAQWKALPDYLKGKASSTLVVCDVSGSMKGDPMNVSIGLGLYLSERLSGDFKNLVCTFSNTPKFFIVPEGTLYERYKSLARLDWENNTNLEKVFTLLLNRAKWAKVPKEDMPDTILVISDMEFDQASAENYTNMESITNEYKVSGYPMPKLVFWNVKGRVGNVPATINDEGVQLISGYSPSIMKYVLEADQNPESLVESIVNDSVYAIIKT